MGTEPLQLRDAQGDWRPLLASLKKVSVWGFESLSDHPGHRAFGGISIGMSQDLGVWGGGGKKGGIRGTESVPGYLRSWVS